MNDNLDPPKPGPLDLGNALVTTILSAVPFASGVYSTLITSPLETSRRDWEQWITKAVRELVEKHGYTDGDLLSNPTFVDCVLKATMIALRNFQEEKREALSNAIYNSALPSAPEYAIQHQFLQYLDYFGEWHVRMLRLYQDPTAAFRERGLDTTSYSMGPPALVLEKIYPTIRAQLELFPVLWRDLFARGLVLGDNLGGNVSGPGIFQRRTTALGDQFVAFISREKS